MWLLKLVDDNGDNMGQRLSAGRTVLWSGIVRNEPGMAGNDFLEKLLGNCCALLTTKDDGEGWVR